MVDELDIQVSTCTPLPGWNSCTYSRIDHFNGEHYVPAVYPNGDYHGGVLLLEDSEPDQGVLVPTKLHLECIDGANVDCSKLNPLL